MPSRILPVCPESTYPVGMWPPLAAAELSQMSLCLLRLWGKRLRICFPWVEQVTVYCVFCDCGSCFGHVLPACLPGPLVALLRRCTFTNESSLNCVQRASCSYLNICLVCAVLHDWIPSTVRGPSWGGGAWAPASGWGTGLGVWRWRARPLTQYCCRLEWDWVRQHGLVERAWLWAFNSDRPWVWWTLALLFIACPWIWYL